MRIPRIQSAVFPIHAKAVHARRDDPFAQRIFARAARKGDAASSPVTRADIFALELWRAIVESWPMRSFLASPLSGSRQLSLQAPQRIAGALAWR
jgi:hypothetical protein